MNAIRNWLFAAALIAAESDVQACVVRTTTRLLRRGEHGDADSAGSTLRTIMVVLVVTAVVGAIGAAVRSAGGRAADCIVNAGC